MGVQHSVYETRHIVPSQGGPNGGDGVDIELMWCCPTLTDRDTISCHVTRLVRADLTLVWNSSDRNSPQVLWGALCIDYPI